MIVIFRRGDECHTIAGISRVYTRDVVDEGVCYFFDFADMEGFSISEAEMQSYDAVVGIHRNDPPMWVVRPGLTDCPLPPKGRFLPKLSKRR